MNNTELIKRMTDLFDRCIEIATAKNSDYANHDDPFQNFRSVETLGISVEDGFLTRMQDKMCRVSNLVRRDAAVTDESVLDTLSDLANYAVLLRVWLEQKRTPGPVYRSWSPGEVTWVDFPPSDDKRSWVDLPTKVYGIGGHYGGVEGDEGFAP
jgi:hypothetical protein